MSSRPSVERFSSGGWQQASKTVSVDAHITGGFLGDIVAIFRNPAAFVETVAVTADGVHFYDLDDGTFTAMSTTREQAWRIEVAGATVTITDLFPPTGGGQAEPMYGSVC